MSKNKKYSNEFKLMVVKEYLEGKGSYPYLAKKHNISNKSLPSKWVNQYLAFGESGLFRARSHKSYPLELKLQALELHKNTEMSQREIANKLNIKNPAQIASWKRAYKKEGIQGLSKKKGRPRMNKLPKEPSKPRNLSKEKELENKIKQLEYELRLEKIKTEYLEALRSLGQEKMKRKQESSTNSEDDTN